jgi:hypothetical protein
MTRQAGSKAFLKLPRWVFSLRLGPKKFYALVDLVSLARPWPPNGLAEDAFRISTRALVLRWDWDRTEVKRFLRWLEALGVLVVTHPGSPHTAKTYRLGAPTKGRGPTSSGSRGVPSPTQRRVPTEPTEMWKTPAAPVPPDAVSVPSAVTTETPDALEGLRDPAPADVPASLEKLEETTLPGGKAGTVLDWVLSRSEGRGLNSEIETTRADEAWAVDEYTALVERKAIIEESQLRLDWDETEPFRSDLAEDS